MTEEAITELSRREQWIVWKYLPPLPGADKPRKVPFCPATGKPASTTDPSTWGTFDAALSVVAAYEGTGFVFSPDDPYVGIDLDSCVDADGHVAEWAADIVLALDSYTERSPSGTGLHVIVRGTLPPSGRRSGPVEMYEQGRYFTITADYLPELPDAIGERGVALRELHRRVFGDLDAVIAPRTTVNRRTVEPGDEDLIERMLRSQHGPAIRALWDGDVSAYDGDDSRADLALVSHLTFWTGGDQARVDRLFRQSGLYRAKWDERRGAQSYGARTLGTTGSAAQINTGAIAL